MAPHRTDNDWFAEQEGNEWERSRMTKCFTLNEWLCLCLFSHSTSDITLSLEPNHNNNVA